MFSNYVLAIPLAFSLAVSPASDASAGSGDALLGGIIGGIIGGAIVDSKNNQRRTTVRRVYVNTAQRAENRQVQTSLNYFNFPAGGADGVLGRRSRAAITSYQIYLGYPATGRLTLFEKDLLINSYQRSIAGGGYTVQLAAANPEGTRGLLKQYQRELVGGAGATVVLPLQQTSPVVDAAANLKLKILLEPQEETVALAVLPTFGISPEASSMADHCNMISLITNTNGGYVTLANMRDSSFALNEQFCLARIYAISNSENLASQVQGFTTAQLLEQCERLAPAMKGEIAALSIGSRLEVIENTEAFILSTGMSPAQLTHTARICLGIGYRTDNADVALASNLILVSLGEPAYGEMLGHHLFNGFGTSGRNDLALQWFDSAILALQSGAPAVFAPGQADRPLLLEAAVAELRPSGVSVPTTTAGFALPNISSVSGN